MSVINILYYLQMIFIFIFSHFLGKKLKKTVTTLEEYIYIYKLRKKKKKKRGNWPAQKCLTTSSRTTRITI